MRTQRFSLRAGLAALALAAVAACDDPGTTPRADAGDELARQVEALGFRGDMVQDFGSYVLVEGDIYLTKAQLRTGPPPRTDDPLRPSYQYRTTNLVGSPKVNNIVVDVSGLALEPGWQTAAREALTHWSGIANSYVRMVEGSPADITVATTCTSYNVAAFASFPSGGNPGSTIYVNTCFGWSTSHAQKVHNMVHELGHTLGFRHSNYTQTGESAGTEGAVHVYGTPTSGNASGSVMNGGTALNSWAGFAASDRNATVTLYPFPSMSVVTTSHPSGTVVLSWSAVSGAIRYQVRRMEQYRDENMYVGTSQITTTEGMWGDVYGTSVDTGATWTGNSNCIWAQSMYEEQITSYWYEVRAVFPNGVGVSGYYSIGTEDADC